MSKFKNINTDMIKKGANLDTVINQEHKLTYLGCEKDGVSLPWVQGGCCDGKYLYEFMVSRDSRHCIIVKYDMATKEIVKMSDDLMLGHANDGAYNPHNNTIAITHCCDLVSNTSNIVNIVDADNLTLKETYELEKFDQFTITYNQNTRQYITCTEKELHYWSEDFKLLDIKQVVTSKGWPSQGIECDGEYVYRLEFFLGEGGKKPETMKNNIRVNDVETGEEIAIIPLNNNRESENMFIYDGKFYFSCNDVKWRGCEVYGFDIFEEQKNI